MSSPRLLPEVDSLRADQRQRRQRIIDAATQLMFEADYEKIQVRDVAERADVALGTLYRYFSSKEHLFACALRSWSQRFGERRRATSEGSPAERVAAVYRRAVRAFERQPRVYGVMIQVQTSKDPHAAAVFHGFTGQQSDAFVQALDGSDLDQQTRLDVVAVMSAVLDESLRNWQLELMTLDQVYAAIDRATRLLLADRP